MLRRSSLYAVISSYGLNLFFEFSYGLNLVMVYMYIYVSV